MPAVTVICGDGIQFLRENAGYFDRNALCYLDPPYVMETRKSGPLYRYEFTKAQHIELLEIARSLPCLVMISGYYSDLYTEALHGWAHTSFQAMTRQGLATEHLWCNFPIPPKQLHDYRYLGKNFRERERIKRKKLRWRKRLEQMKPLERYALLEALAESESGTLSPETARAPAASPE